MHAGGCHVQGEAETGGSFHKPKNVASGPSGPGGGVGTDSLTASGGASPAGTARSDFQPAEL